MKKIAFSWFYSKLRDFVLDVYGDGFVNVQLIGAFRVLSCELEECFWDYDADGIKHVERFGYADDGDKELILLLFRHENKIFTTVRPFKWQTYKYYRDQVGNKFEVVMT